MADKSMFEISGLWKPKFRLGREDPVVSFGSCFARRIGAALRDRGYSWLVTEQPPLGLEGDAAHEFGYDIFSCRTGNIYTTSLLRQWVSWATGQASVPDEVWEGDEGVFDPFRPTMEPGGFASVEEMRQSREVTLECLRKCISDARFFVFTMGLTESWFNKDEGYEYPICPGTAAGSFDADRHVFVNQDFDQVRSNLAQAIGMMREINPKLRFILTVSPVPMTATNSGQHVLVATMYTKSVLRGVAGLLGQIRQDCDYFPGYEIINSPVFRGTFSAPNQRNISAFGVEFVMDHFCSPLEPKSQQPSQRMAAPAASSAQTGDDFCDEELLDAFRSDT